MATAIQKETRLNIRANSIQKQTIEKAANLMQTTISAFVLEHSYRAAQQMISEQSNIFLNEQDWAAFCTALDEPPKEISELNDLFRPGLFDEQKSN